MSDHIYKIIEISGTSSESFDKAVSNAIARAGKSVHNMRWFQVEDVRGHIDGRSIDHWQVVLKVGFTLDE
jgi:flavin-binding protein dodecin